MTRVIAGSARGRRLEVPVSGTRPTADRVREAMFSSLAAMLSEDGIAWRDLHVLDGYAGSGALGLEALSRGAASATFIEHRAAAVAVIRRNVEAIGVRGADVVTADLAVAARRARTGAPCGLVLLDPPYEVPSETMARELGLLCEHGWLAAEARVVIERPKSDHASPLPPGWMLVKHRAYGDTALWYGRRMPDSGAPQSNQEASDA